MSVDKGFTARCPRCRLFYLEFEQMWRYLSKKEAEWIEENGSVNKIDEIMCPDCEKNITIEEDE